MDPNFANGHFELGLIYGAKGVFGKAISEFQAGRSLDPANPLMLSLLGHAYGAAGNRKDAKNVLRDLTILAKQEPVSAFHFAIVHMGLNENDQAFELLNKAWDERYWMMGWLKVDPFFDSLRPDPRFTALVRRIGFPEQDSKARGVMGAQGSVETCFLLTLWAVPECGGKERETRLIDRSIGVLSVNGLFDQLSVNSERLGRTYAVFAIAASRTPPWLASGWGCRGRRLSRD
jgi:hypothetical protein